MDKKVFLLIMDGYGLREEAKDNAPLVAKTPNLDRIFSTQPFTSIFASSEYVGLPEGYIGSSEVGHMNIGAGRIVLQGLEKINHDIKRGTIKENVVFGEAFGRAQGRTLHLMGLLSDAGVHSHIEHLFALMKLAKTAGVKDIVIHVFLDGRDVEPSCAQRYIKQLETFCRDLGLGRIASVHGRYYAMDRDNRWERTLLSYEALVKSQGLHAVSAHNAVAASYERGESDEFVRPTLITQDRIKEGDAVIHFNFREDRARQLSAALGLEVFDGFDRGNHPHVHYVCMTEYDKHFGLPVAYPKDIPKNSLGEYLSGLGKTQLRIAETEKYAHVTYFFSGGRQEKFPGEERILIESDRTVATYDLAPAMKTADIAKAAIDFVSSQHPDLVVCNIAAPDMVGHTGVWSATVSAIEIVDAAVAQIEMVCKEQGYVLVITADHGNCEEMTGLRQTSHTLNPVPFCVVGADSDFGLIEKEKGVLGDIAPTILKIMGIKKPVEMDREGLIRS